jgi:hypothetical protein
MNDSNNSPYSTIANNGSTPLYSNILQSTTFPLNVYDTPRKRKVAPSTPGAPLRHNPLPQGPRPWPRLGQEVPIEILEDVTCQIFGYKPYNWQLKLTVKVLEGHDVIGLAGTGRGKSLIFGMLAIAAALAGVQGVVIVICPLKSLQTDQVSRCQKVLSRRKRLTFCRSADSMLHVPLSYQGKRKILGLQLLQ